MKQFLFVLLAVICIPAGGAFAIETPARQAFMIDMDTRTVLLDKNGEEQMHPSSMSKLMTVYIIFERLKDGRLTLEDTFKASEKAWRTQGSKMFVELGKEITLEDLVHGIITQSGNDACIVVAEGISGTEESFAKLMNQTAKRLGLKHSHFVNATGWPDDGHLMSARDLAILSERLIRDFPEYYEFFKLPEYTYHNIRQFNRNRLLGTLGVDGLKTGHTEAGGYGIVLSAKQDGRRLILVLNGLESDDARVKEGDRLLRYGFREFENRKVLSKGQTAAHAMVWFGKQRTVPLIAAEDVVATLPVAAAREASFILKYTGPLKAPVEKGAHVADLVIRRKDGTEMVIPLQAGETVPKLSGFRRMIAIVKHYIFKKD